MNEKKQEVLKSVVIPLKQVQPIMYPIIDVRREMVSRQWLVSNDQRGLNGSR